MTASSGLEEILPPSQIMGYDVEPDSARDAPGNKAIPRRLGERMGASHGGLAARRSFPVNHPAGSFSKRVSRWGGRWAAVPAWSV